MRGSAASRKAGRPIDWKLITDLPVRSPEEAVEKLGWYARRWKIELFHKILKSGCRAEEARLRTAERLVNLLALFCILSWRHVLADDAQPRRPGCLAPARLDRRRRCLLDGLARPPKHTARRADALAAT